MSNKFCQWLRPEHRKPFYIVVGLIVFCAMCIVGLAVREDTHHRDTLIKLIGYGGGFLGLLYLIIRSEQSTKYQHDSTHQMAEGQQQIANRVEEIPDKVVSTINGGMDKAAERAVNNMTLEQLRHFIAENRSSLCGDIATEAAEKAALKTIDELENRGWRPPEQ